MAPPPWLPDDLIREILSRTPVKSVCRFRCVSRGWRALISDPAFAAAHRCPDHLLVGGSVNLRTGNLEIKVMDMDDGKVLRVIDIGDNHCSLLTAIDGAPHVDMSSGQMVDLATGQVLAPFPPELRKTAGCLFTVGRVTATATYKAVHVTVSRWPACMVLTLGEEDAEWRVAPPPPDGASIFYSEKSLYSSDCLVTINGVVHFLTAAKNTPPEDGNHDVLCFDLESETWKETIRGPPIDAPATTAARETTVTSLNNTLCMSVHGGGEDPARRTDVWLRRDSGGWTKAYSILADSLVRPLMVMTRGDGRRRLLLSCVGEDGMRPVVRVYDPLAAAAGEACTEEATKLPADIWGGVGICSLHLKHAVPNLYLAT